MALRARWTVSGDAAADAQDDFTTGEHLHLSDDGYGHDGRRPPLQLQRGDRHAAGRRPTAARRCGRRQPRHTLAVPPAA